MYGFVMNDTISSDTQWHSLTALDGVKLNEYPTLPQ